MMCNCLERARTPLLQEGSSGKASRRRIAGRVVEVLNDHYFKELREKHKVPEDFLDTGNTQALNLDLPRLESSHGKGGHGQFNSSCRRYVVKSLSKDDHKALLRLAGPLVDRMLQNRTLMCPIYLHFMDVATGRFFMAMRNLTEAGPWAAKYDLKGCDDDKTIELNGKTIQPVRKRFYRPHMWCQCMWSPERWLYYQGKVQARALRLGVAGSHHEEVIQMIKSDAEWLISHDIMDYSLLVAVRRLPPEVAKSCGAGLDSVACPGDAAIGLRRWAMLDKTTGELLVLHMGIIDFLQPWTTSKVAAMYIKSFEFNKATVPPPLYGQRFAKHFEERLKKDDTLTAQSETVTSAAERWCQEHDGMNGISNGDGMPGQC
ncbi:unnamed protein product [Symbiodinium natans]|uniref:PIPK domain-containing protein n=1 Tax=Symbiodinium natans TaxID=878477 RepID=A0A812JTD6_9DINO|nr:unnamed protein product [Symbiodinium natans]